MELKNLIIDYIQYEKAYKNLNNIKKISKRYNKIDNYELFSILINIFLSIIATYFISSFITFDEAFTNISQSLAIFLGLPIIFGAVITTLSITFLSYFNLVTLKKIKNINKITTLLFSGIFFQNMKKLKIFNEKINKDYSDKDIDNIFTLRKLISKTKKYRRAQHKKKFPLEREEYSDKSAYQESYNHSNKKIGLIDILEYKLLDSEIIEIRNLDQKLFENIIKKLNTLDQKRILDIVNDKILEEENKNINEDKIIKNNAIVIDKLYNKTNNKIIREI
jgi:hypothetical protein